MCIIKQPKVTKKNISISLKAEFVVGEELQCTLLEKKKALNQHALFVSLEFLFNIFVFLQKALLFLPMGDAGGCLRSLNAPRHQ